MARADKADVVVEVREHLTASAATLLTHYRGLGVGDLAELRERLRAVDAELKVVKNTLARRAADEAGMAALADLLEGPTGIVFCGSDPVGPAKALRAFAKDHPELVVRGGFLDGAVLDASAAAGLADLASREELLARMAGLLLAPLAAMARLLQEPIAAQARAMQALADKGGAAGESAASPAPVAVAEAAAPATESDVAAAEPTAEAATESDAEAEDAASDEG